MTDYLRHLLDPTLLFGALSTLAILSLVFKENRFYRLFEHIFLGLALGYDLYFTWTSVLRPLFWNPMVTNGQWVYVLLVPLGLTYYAIFFPRIAWMSRLVFGLLFGLGAGTVFQVFCARFMPQVVKSFKPLVPPPPTPGDAHATLHQISFVLNNVLFLVILVSVLVYFFFAFEQKNRAVMQTARLGRLFLMLSFGAVFGSTIMTRMALLIDRLYYLFVEWLRLAPP